MNNDFGSGNYFKIFYCFVPSFVIFLWCENYV